MSKVANSQKLASIAEDAIDHARYCTEQTRWLNALVRSIDLALEGGDAPIGVRVSLARDLAGLACYLSNDLSNWSATRAKEFQTELDAVEGGVQ